MQNLIIYLILKLLAVMPLPLARGIGALMGLLCWQLKTQSARITLINLSHCFPEMATVQRKKLARNSMREWGKSLLEIPVVWGHPTGWLMGKIVGIENVELFETYKTADRGLTVIAPHLGNWEVVGLYCSTRGEITSLFAPTESQALNRQIRNSREQAGAKLVPTDSRGVAALLKALKNQRMAGILPDQVPARESGEYAPFFGRSALTMTLIHRLINRSGAKAIFCYAKRVPRGFTLVFKEPPPALYSDKCQESLAALNRGVEECVRDIPEQYQWEYKRFRRQPQGAADIYKAKAAAESVS